MKPIYVPSPLELAKLRAMRPEGPNHTFWLVLIVAMGLCGIFMEVGK